MHACPSVSSLSRVIILPCIFCTACIIGILLPLCSDCPLREHSFSVSRMPRQDSRAPPTATSSLLSPHCLLLLLLLLCVVHTPCLPLRPHVFYIPSCFRGCFLRLSRTCFSSRMNCVRMSSSSHMSLCCISCSRLASSSLSLSLSLSQSAWLVAIVALARSFFAVRPHNDEIRSQCPKRSGKGIHFLNCEKTLFSLLGI